MSSGYIRYHRKILDNPIVMKDADYFAIWSYLLLKATHTKIPVLFMGKRIELQPGQLITGRKIIAKDLKGISESKIYRVLNCYESEQQIEQQKDTKNTLITIKNWQVYQKGEQQLEQNLNETCTESEQQSEQQNGSKKALISLEKWYSTKESEQQIEQQMNNKRTTTEQQVNTNNNVNNEINEINIKEKIDKKEKDKIHFADFVTMTNAEYEVLVSTYGKEFTDQCITVLDNYKGSSGKKYKSDYRAILSWVVDSVKRKNKEGNGFKTKHERSREILEMEREKIRRENEQRGSN